MSDRAIPFNIDDRAILYSDPIKGFLRGYDPAVPGSRKVFPYELLEELEEVCEAYSTRERYVLYLLVSRFYRKHHPLRRKMSRRFLKKIVFRDNISVYLS